MWNPEPGGSDDQTPAVTNANSSTGWHSNNGGDSRVHSHTDRRGHGHTDGNASTIKHANEHAYVLAHCVADPHHRTHGHCVAGAHDNTFCQAGFHGDDYG